MATPVAALTKLIDNVRELLKNKTAVTSDGLRAKIAEFEAQLATRDVDRVAIERAWGDSILEATVSDQAKHRERLEAFDLETGKTRAIIDVLTRRLEEAVAAEAEGVFQDEVTRARQLLNGVDEEAASIDALAEQYCERLLAFYERQQAFGQLSSKYQGMYSDSLRGDERAAALFRRWSEETADAQSAVKSRNFFATDLLRDGRSVRLHRLGTDRIDEVLWPSLKVNPPLGWGSR